MANDKKFIVKNGLLTPENAVIGSNTDTGEQLQVTGDTVLTQATAGTPTLKVINTGGNNAVIGQFEGDAAALQVKNLVTGDYQLVNTGNNNGIIFYNDTGGISIQYNGGDRLVISNSGNEFSGLSNTTIDGNRILTTADEGSGNGLDADTVDGLEAAQFVRADVDDIMAGNYTIQQNLTVSGDLTVSGNTTTVNTEEILLADNIITINSNYTGSSPTEDGGIEVERGTLSNAKVIWNESNDWWQLEVNGSVLGRIITTADEGSGNGFDADTVDGLEGSQFLRSDVDDTAEGNITIEGDLTIGDNTGPAQIFFDGTNVNRTLYSNNGEIGFLNTSANWAVKSDAQGDLEVERDVEAGRDVLADGDVTAQNNVTATTGNVSATAGDVTAGDDVIAQNNVTATTGNVSATAGNVTAGNDVTAQNDITATTGDITASAGSVTAQVNVTATTGDVSATAGNVTAGDSITAQNDITATTGDISASAGAVSAATTVTAGTDVIGQRFVDADNNSYIANPAGTSVFNDLGIDDDLFHNGDTDTKIQFTTDDISLQTGGSERLGANNSGVQITGDLDVSGDISGGTGTFTGDVTAPRFVDADDTNYFADPAASSEFHELQIDDWIRHRGNVTTYLGFPTNDAIRFATDGTERVLIDTTYVTSTLDGIFPNLYAGRYYDSANATYYLDPASSSRLNDISLVGEIIHDGDADTYIHFPAADQFAVVTGGSERLRVQNGYVLANNQMRSPIYYDNDDTAYYGNFAGDSQMQEVHIDDWIRHRGDTNTYLGFPTADTIEFTTGGGIRATINNTNATFNSDVLADRFVDRNSTGYYLDPANGTLSATLNGSVRIANIADSARYSDSSGTGGIALAGDADSDASQSTMLAISGQYRSGAFALMYLNRIDANVNPFNAGNRYIEFRADGASGGAAFRGDSSGNFYLTPQASQNIGFWTSGGNEVAVALDDGNFVVGGSSVSYTSMDNTPLVGSITNNKLHVNGSIQLTSNDDAIVFGRGTSSFLKDEELGFGWGSGWYMTDASYLRVRNNTTVYSTGNADFNAFRSYQNTAYYLDPDGDSQLNTVDIDDYVRHRGDTNTFIGFPSNDTIRLATNNNARLDITNSYVRARNAFQVYGSGITLQKQSNGGGVGLEVSDNHTGEFAYTQSGSIKFYHADDSVVTGGDAFWYFNSTEVDTYYVFGSQAGADGGTLVPIVDNTGELGTSAYRWNSAYITNANFTNVYASRYYDADDNSFYGDFNSRSEMNSVNLRHNSAVVAGNGNFNTASSVLGGLHFRNGAGVNGAPRMAAITFQGDSATAAQAGIYVSNDNSSGTHMAFAVTNNYSTGPQLTARFRNDGLFQTYRAYALFAGSARAPIFYASDNTAYYVDPNGDSQLNTIDIDDYIRHRNDTNTYFGFESNDTFRVWTNGNQRLNIDNNSADFSINVYAPRYYDSNDASFYTDPAGTSLQRRLNLYSGESTGEFNVGRGSTQRFNMYVTDGIGYIRYYQDETGGQDHSVSFEIQSGSSGSNEFRFNRPLNVNGSGSAGYIYARRFVDRDNTSYFVDPASNSFMASVTLQQNPVGTAYYGVAAQPTYYFGQQRGDNDAWKIYGESPAGTNTGNLILQSEDDYDSNESIRMRFKRTYSPFDTNDVLQAYYNYVLSPNSFRAPVFYDSNDTAYYGDFNGRSILYQASVANQLTAGATSGYVTNAVLDVAGPAVMRGTNNLYFGVTTTNYNSWQSRIYNRTSSTMAFDAQTFEWGNVGYSSGAARMFFTGATGVLQVNGDVRTPIMYDLNNTGYYVDPASNSRFNTTQALRYYMNHGTSYWIDEASGNYGSIMTGGRRSGWAGYSIEGNWVFMGETNEVGIYNDIDNKWILQSYRNQWLRLYYNGALQAQTASGYFLANNQMRAPIYYDSNNTGYYLDPAAGNTSNALRIAGRIRRDNFQTSGDGNNNRLLEAQDYSHWIWNTASDWGIFWAGNNNPYRSHFSTSNPNEIVFIGNGNLRASIDLDNGNAHFTGTVSAGSFALNGGNENIEIIKSYGSGGADLVLFDATEYFDKRVIKAMAPNESPLTGTTSEYVRTTDGPFAGSYVLQTSNYRTFYSDYIPVAPGEELYGEISVKRISGSGGLLYYGLERFDSQKRPIAGNTGTTYFVVGGVNYTSTSWTTYRNHTTIPTSHTPYNGSDGGGVYYVRIRILMNYNSGGALRQFAGIMLKRRNAESNLLVDDLQVLDDVTIGGDLDAAGYGRFGADVRGTIFYDQNNTNRYLDPSSSGNSLVMNGSVNAQTHNKTGLLLNASGTGSAGAALGMQQVTAEGWTGIFVDFEPYTGWGMYHDNPNNFFSFTAEASTGSMRSFTVPSRNSGNRTAYEKFRIDQNNGDFITGRNGYANSSFRAPIFYDSNDTNYYVNPNSDSVLHNVNVRNFGLRLQRNYTHNGIWWNGGTDQNHVLWNHYYGGPAGRGGAGSGGFDGMLWNTYQGLRIRGGSAGAYNIARFSTDGGGNTNSHYVQLYANNVEQLGTRGGYGYAPNQMRSPIYYDTNTAYFGNFNGESSLNTLRTAGRVVIGGNFSNNAYSSVNSTRLHFGGGDSDANGNYYIGTNKENYNGNYTKLDLRWHTGIRMGAQAVYGGTRIYNNEDLSTLLFSVGRSDTHVRVESGSNLYVTSGDARATIFYDINDTNWYANPNGTSRFRELDVENNGSQEVFRAYRYGSAPGNYTAARSINQYGNHSWGIVHEFRVGEPGSQSVPSGTDRPSIMFSSGYSTTPWSVGFGYVDDQFRIKQNHGHINQSWGTERFRIDTGGNVIIPGALYAPIIYDSNNSGYYVDPNGTSRMNSILANRIYPCYDNNTGVYIDYPTGNYGSIQVNGGGKGGWEGYSINGRYVFMSADNSQVGIYNDVDNEWMLYAERNSHLYLYHNGQWEARTDSGYFRMERSGRAPIFYDLNDTGYYVNPNGQSHMNTLTLAGNRLGFINTNFDAEIRVTDDNPDGTGATFVFYGDTVAYNAEVATEVFRATRHMRAPRYYDLNNASYYGDFASTSYMNDVRANIVYDRNNTAYYIHNSSGDASMRTVTVDRLNMRDRGDFITFYGNDSDYHSISSRDNGGSVTDDLRFNSYHDIFFNLDSNNNNSTGSTGFYIGQHGAATGGIQGWAFQAMADGNSYSNSSFRTYTFYAREDTGYYVDPNGTTQLRYVLANDWFRPQGNTGLYFQSYGHGIWAPEAEGNPYGNVATYGGGRNGWRGYGIGSRHTLMNQNSTGVGLHDNSRGWLKYYNGSYHRDYYGYYYNDQSVRSPIFYDLNDTAFYFNGASTNSTRFRGVQPETMAYMALPGHTRNSGEYYRARPRITGDSNYWTGAMGWGRIDMNAVATWGSGFIDSWSNPPNQPSGTSHWVGVQAFHYRSSNTNGYGWQMVGGPITNLRFRSSWSGWRSWRTIPVLDENSTNGGAMYAGIYYDSNNTGYYANPNSTSNFYRLQLVNELHVSTGNGTGVGIRLADDGDIVDNNNGYCTMRFSSGVIIGNGNRSSSARHYLYSSGRLDSTSQNRSPIFYDRNSSGYYGDFASTSRLNQLNVNRINSPYAGGNSGITRSSSPYSFGFQESGGWGYPYPDMVFQYHTGVSMAANPSYGGIRFFNDYNSGTVRFQINGGSSYTYANTWLQVGGANVGIYDGYNSAHFYPNAQTNYGSWNISGSRSGWRGLAFHDAGYDPHLMWDSSGNGGFYHEDLGRWLLYHNRSNNCMGVASSSTRSGYRMQVNGSLWCTGNIVAYSDERRKENIETIENGLEKVLQLRGVTYTRKLADWEEKRDNSFQGKQMGLIAQEVMEIVPEVVTHDVEDDEFGIDYPKMVGLLVEAHKDQQKLINSQQEKIDKLEEMLYNIMDKMENK